MQNHCLRMVYSKYFSKIISILSILLIFLAIPKRSAEIEVYDILCKNEYEILKISMQLNS